MLIQFHGVYRARDFQEAAILPGLYKKAATSHKRAKHGYVIMGSIRSKPQLPNQNSGPVQLFVLPPVVWSGLD